MHTPAQAHNTCMWTLERHLNICPRHLTMHLHKVNSWTSADRPYYPAHCIAQEVMESVMSDSFCVTIFGWGLVAQNASPNVVYSTISACRCRQIRPFVSSSPRIVPYGGSPLKSSHFLRHFSPHNCARASLRYPGAQWKLPSGYFFWCTYQSSYFPPSTPICSREFAAHLSRLLLACKCAD